MSLHKEKLGDEEAQIPLLHLDGSIRSLDGSIRSLDGLIGSLDDLIQSLDDLIRSLDRLIRSLDEATHSLNGSICSLDRVKPRSAHLKIPVESELFKILILFV